MNEYVLDASAVLALLNEEPGSALVEESLAHSVIGAVNLAEVVSKLADAGMPREAIGEALEGLALRVHPFDRELAIETGLLRPATKHRGLSLGDRACLAVAKTLGFPVLTTDGSWQKVKLGSWRQPGTPDRQGKDRGAWSLA